ncbi:MAG: gfo/Idh/MocA family oxidoreductase, partial [Clostridia bacterium]|nr:gfo/Idh/MocA family oxidoreductase [Clostridia bacterium]
FGGVSSDPTKLPATSHVIMVKDLANAINNDTKPMVTPREGRVAVDFILDIYESSKENKEIVY